MDSNLLSSLKTARPGDMDALFLCLLPPPFVCQYASGNRTGPSEHTRETHATWAMFSLLHCSVRRVNRTQIYANCHYCFVCGRRGWSHMEHNGLFGESSETRYIWPRQTCFCCGSILSLPYPPPYSDPHTLAWPSPHNGYPSLPQLSLSSHFPSDTLPLPSPFSPTRPSLLLTPYPTRPFLYTTHPTRLSPWPSRPHLSLTFPPDPSLPPPLLLLLLVSPLFPSSSAGTPTHPLRGRPACFGETSIRVRFGYLLLKW